MLAFALAAILSGCKPLSYPLTTCVVCAQSLDKQESEITFVQDGQEVKVCSPAHKAEYQRDPAKYSSKIKEVKIL